MKKKIGERQRWKKRKMRLEKAEGFVRCDQTDKY